MIIIPKVIKKKNVLINSDLKEYYYLLYLKLLNNSIYN